MPQVDTAMSKNESNFGTFFAMQPLINYLSSENEENIDCVFDNASEFVYEPCTDPDPSIEDAGAFNASDADQLFLDLNYKDLGQCTDELVVQETPVKVSEENVSVNQDLVLSVQKKIHLYPDGSLRDDVSTQPSQAALKFLQIGTPFKNDSVETIVNIPDFLSPILHSKPTTTACTPKKANVSNCELSPELFSDEDFDENVNNISDIMNKSVTLIKSFEEFKKDKHTIERNILKKFQESMRGIPPPTSITHCQINAEDLLEKINQNRHLLDVCLDSKPKCRKQEKIEAMPWPEVKNEYFYGLHYNRSRISEDIEHLSQKYVERYIGSETSSTCIIEALKTSASASKRKLIRKQSQCKSPGRRLSHLARRRIAFSKENLASKSGVLSALSASNSRRQMVLDLRRIYSNEAIRNRFMSPRKRSPRKSPRKRTPRKTPTRPSPSPRKKNRTPGSAKKRLIRNAKIVEEDLSEPVHPSTSSLNPIDRPSSSKRALFQSPSNKSSPHNLSMSNSRRALFTSPNSKKRKRTDAIETNESDLLPGNKVARSFSTNDVHSNKNLPPISARRHSEMPSSSKDFSAVHKKKMLWAVSEALRSQDISMRHPEFKVYAASLVRICKAMMPDLIGGSRICRIPGSTSERMLKITRQYVLNVIKGQSVDSIIKEALLKNVSTNQTKPKGYIAPEDFINRENVPTSRDIDPNTEKNSSTRCVLKENLINSLDNKAKFKRQITFD